MTPTNMKCPVRGATELTHDTRDLSYAYKGETSAILAVRVTSVGLVLNPFWIALSLIV